MWVEKEWQSRRNWWPAFHFSFFWAKSDWKADADLACEKAFVAGILLGKGLWCFLFIWMELLPGSEARGWALVHLAFVIPRVLGV